MKYVSYGTDVSSIECGVRNSWKWYWLDEYSSVSEVKYDYWCHKVPQAGKCFCSVCNKIIIFGSSGKKALRSHDEHQDHIDRVKSVITLERISSESGNGADEAKRNFTDRCAEVKSVIGLFLSEHCLPFSLGPELLSLSQRLGEHPESLNSTTLSHPSTTYTTGRGVGAYIKDKLNEKLKNTHFSLNIDEATSNAGNTILNILAQYYDSELKRNVVDLLGSREVNQATASYLFAATEEVLFDRGLKWDQVIIVMMDNCSVMRGVNEGLETKIRRVNTNLLDISGDSVHMVNNACKKLFHFLGTDFFNVQSFISDVYYDIEDSPKVKDLFRKTQHLIIGKELSIVRPIPTRFLQMQTVTERFMELWDPIRVYYSAFLSSREQDVKDQLLADMKETYKLSDEDMVNIGTILSLQKKQTKSDASTARKERIVHKLFDATEQSMIMVQLYRGVLEKFQGYTKLFQSAKPLVHSLHVELYDGWY